MLPGPPALRQQQHKPPPTLPLENEHHTRPQPPPGCRAMSCPLPGTYLRSVRAARRGSRTATPPQPRTLRQPPSPPLRLALAPQQNRCPHRYRKPRTTAHAQAEPARRRAAGGGGGASRGCGGVEVVGVLGAWGCCAPLLEAHGERLTVGDWCPLRRLFSGGGDGRRRLRRRKGGRLGASRPRKAPITPRVHRFRGPLPRLRQGGAARRAPLTAVLAAAVSRWAGAVNGGRLLAQCTNLPRTLG